MTITRADLLKDVTIKARKSAAIIKLEKLIRELTVANAAKTHHTTILQGVEVPPEYAKLITAMTIRELTERVNALLAEQLRQEKNSVWHQLSDDAIDRIINEIA